MLPASFDLSVPTAVKPVSFEFRYTVALDSVPFVVKDGFVRCRICNYKLGLPQADGSVHLEAISAKLQRHYRTEHRRKS
jgi:hypothetical protein